MRLHTNASAAVGAVALQKAKDAGQVTPDIQFTGWTEHGSRTHARAFEIQLGTYLKGSLPPGYRDQHGRAVSTRRFKNLGESVYEPSVYAATWHEWGWFMARLFEADPDARWDRNYNGVLDFDLKTGNQFTKEDA